MAARSSPSFAMLAAAAFAVLLGETLFADEGAAEVYLAARRGLSSVLAVVAGAPEGRPRDLVVNGAPLAFTPYRSAREVDEIARDWIAALSGNARPVGRSGDPFRDELATAANLMIEPKVARTSEEFTAVVQFFDGDGQAALKHLSAGSAAAGGAGEASVLPPMPGVAVLIRRSGDGADAEVLMSRFADVPAALAAFAEPADASRLPVALRPPPGGTVLGDIGDRGASHRSRTVVTSARMAPAAFAAMRTGLLRRSGFVPDAAPDALPGGLPTLRARRGSVEADVLYSPGLDPGEVVEVIEIREPLVAGGTP